MYDRTGMHQGYRHPGAQFGAPGNPGYSRMMGAGHPGYHAQPSATPGLVRHPYFV